MGKYSFSNIQDKRMEDRRPVPKKVIKRIAPRSKKRIESDKELAKIRIRKISEDAVCKIQGPNCTGVATVLNHKQKTSPKNRLQEENLEQCCTACNLWIELNVEEAKANGHQVSRFKKQ